MGMLGLIVLNVEVKSIKSILLPLAVEITLSIKWLGRNANWKGSREEGRTELNWSWASNSKQFIRMGVSATNWENYGGFRQAKVSSFTKDIRKVPHHCFSEHRKGCCQNLLFFEWWSF